MASEKTTSGWVWVFLILMLASFAVFIVFLDQKIVSNSQQQNAQEEQVEDRNKPKFDFYSILRDRKMEVTISEDQKEGIENPSINKTSGGKVLLQVGSFQTTGKADSLKAELAFLGLEAEVNSAVIKNDTWYRVEIGPFASNSALSRAKNLLLENNIQYSQRSTPQ